jgi:two-component system, chemotaxis family, response regulator Rcp1
MMGTGGSNLTMDAMPLLPQPGDPFDKEPDAEEPDKQPVRISVLLVEDNPSDIHVISKALRASGISFDLEVASDGEQALSRLSKSVVSGNRQAPAIILLDWNLPRVSGSDVLAYVRRNETLRNIPVVVVTSTNSTADLKEMSKLGANAHFRKPTDLDAYLELKTIVLDLLSKPPKTSP